MKFDSYILRIIILLGLIGIVDQFATDCYLASFPNIAKTFNTSNSAVQLSLTLFFFGVALAQLFYGALSDLYGRKPMLIMGMFIFTFGGLICLVTPNIDLFLIGRFIQGFGMGSGMVIARAMTRDLFSDIKFSQVVSFFSALIILIMLISPIVGGYIQYYFGWRYIFLLLVSLSILLLLAVLFRLPETFTKEKRTYNKISDPLKSYIILVKNKFFVINVLCASLPTALLAIYITITPFLYQHVLKLSPVMFGWTIAFIAIGGAIGNLLNSKFVTKIGMDLMIKIGILWMLIPILVMLIIGLFGLLNLYAIIIPMFIAVMGIGAVSANASSKALNPFPNMAGGAAAIYGGIQILISTIFTAVAVLVHTKNQIPLALLLLMPSVILVFLLFFLEKTQNSDQFSNELKIENGG